MFERCLGSGTISTRSRIIILFCLSFLAVVALLETLRNNQFWLSESNSSDLQIRNLYNKSGKDGEPQQVLEEVSAEPTPAVPDRSADTLNTTSYEVSAESTPAAVPDRSAETSNTTLYQVSAELAPAVPDRSTENLNPYSYKTLNISKILADEEGQGADDEEQPNPNPSPGEPYRLGRKTSNWDQIRAKWLKDNPDRPSTVGRRKRPRVLLVTSSSSGPCESPVGDHLLLRSIKNKIDYCRLHDIGIFYSMAVLEAEMGGFWVKLPLIKELMLGNPEAEFIWWMDSDAVFTDMVFEVPWKRYKHYNLVVPGWSEKVYEEKDWIGLNMGVFLIRNCQWSFDLIDAWAAMGHNGKVREEAGQLLTKEVKGRPPSEADDQSAMVYLLASQRQVWGSKVYFETRYCLHGYWDVLVDKYEELMDKYKPGFGDDRWPFVTHFVGCKPCASSGNYPAERCLRQMDRAFGFADNQVMKAYGFAHVSLGSRRLKRIRNMNIESPPTDKGVR